jgi:molybdenum cofactor biosynthesis enzyme MoaA
MGMSIARAAAISAIDRRNAFDRSVERATEGPLTGRTIDTVQVNVGIACNLACRHCHVESSPKRSEQMEWNTMVDVLEAARRAGAHTLDTTGGALTWLTSLRRAAEYIFRHCPNHPCARVRIHAQSWMSEQRSQTLQAAAPPALQRGSLGYR